MHTRLLMQPSLTPTDLLYGPVRLPSLQPRGVLCLLLREQSLAQARPRGCECATLRGDLAPGGGDLAHRGATSLEIACAPRTCAAY